MTARIRSQVLLSALSLGAMLLGGCDPKAASGAVGVGGAPVSEPTAAPLPGKPMPGDGVTPTLPPQPVDPLHDPIDPTPKTLVEGPSSIIPWKLLNPAAKSGCKCQLVCGPVNDDGSKDCITMCEGTGC